MASMVLVLAACGGGGGGGGDATSEYVIRVAIANETADTATLQVNDGEPQTVDTCTGGVFIFNLPATDWVLTVNSETAVDSLELDPNYLDKNLVTNMWLYSDGRLEVERTIPGSNIQAPPKLIICA
ncbi:MAG TPA: hypothetical protein VK838_00485 [Candidatus Limnocylindrales bacterium]|nr:hypothetical protein [Candidatus Limnocylindrales bacterium]